MVSNFEVAAEVLPAKKLVVLLHGLGSDGLDLLGLVPFFKDSFPSFHFYSPNGIEECDMAPSGFQWFSLKNREPGILLSEMERVSERVIDMIEDKLTELNLTFSDLILIGFSQGCMMSLYLAHAYDLEIAALIGFSGAFIPPKVIKSTLVPICLIHGIDDDVVSFASMAASEDRLKKAGVKVIETHAIKNLTHTIDLSGINYAKEFIKKYVRV